VPDGPLKEFAQDLRELRRATGMTYRELARRAGYSYSVLSAAASGLGLPTLPVTLAYVGACTGDAPGWEARWNELASQLRATQPGLLPPEAQQAPPGQAPSADGAPVPPVRPSTAGSGDGPLLEPLGTHDPRRIGVFRTLGRLGGGAMGEVYLASSPAGRPAAVKLIRPQLARDALFRRRFAAELAAARKVTGGHSPAVIDADPDAERPWMATAYVPGPSLGEVVDVHGPLPEPVVLGLAAGIAEALAAFHAAGIVHRDLKPSNVLLAEDGPKVIDFGISRALDASALTATGAQVGTAGFMAPEQAEGTAVTAAADVFSLGCVLAYAATGLAPFGQGPSASVLYRVVHDQPAKEALACQDKQLRDLIAQCLDKDPQRRPTPARIIEAAAAGGCAGEGWLPAAIAAQAASRSAHAARLMQHAARRRTLQRVRVALAPLLLILAILAAVVLLGRGGTGHGLSTEPPASTAPGLGGAPTPAVSGAGSPGTGRSSATAPAGSGASGNPGGAGGKATAGAAAGTSTATSGAGALLNSTSAAAQTTSSPRYSFENSTDGWGTAQNSDVTRASSSAFHDDGSYALAMTDTAAQANTYVGVVISALSDGPAPGNTSTAWIYVPSGTSQSIKAHLYIQRGSAWQNAPDTVLTPGGWHELAYTTPAAFGAVTSVGVQFSKSGTTGVTVYLDAVTWH